MDTYTVSLFGHRRIDDLIILERKLEAVVEELILSKDHIIFFIGRNGEFDEYAASVIKRTRRKTGKENCEIILVLPYTVSNIEYYEKYYDDIIIPETQNRVHPRAMIEVKNRWMIEHSDLVIAYLMRDNGGAYKAVKYARRLGKKVINAFLK